MAATEIVDVRSRRREQTRGEILQAAWLLAERNGVATLSLRALAGAVGMRAPSLYTYFANKAAIYDAMFTQGYRELDLLYDAVDVEAGSPAAALADGTRRFLEFCQASLPRYQLMFTRVVADWQPSPAAYAVSQASYQRMAERLTVLGIEGERALDLWIAITAGLAAQQLANDPTGDRWLRLSDDAAAMFLDHLGRMR